MTIAETEIPDMTLEAPRFTGYERTRVRRRLGLCERMSGVTFEKKGALFEKFVSAQKRLVGSHSDLKKIPSSQSSGSRPC
jgi:hypothetical protein